MCIGAFVVMVVPLLALTLRASRTACGGPLRFGVRRHPSTLACIKHCSVKLTGSHAVALTASAATRINVFIAINLAGLCAVNLSAVVSNLPGKSVRFGVCSSQGAQCACEFFAVEFHRFTF
jgi:hypothetical protein